MYAVVEPPTDPRPSLSPHNTPMKNAMNRIRSQSQSLPRIPGLSPSSSSKALHNDDDQGTRLTNDLSNVRAQHRECEEEKKAVVKELEEAQNTNTTLRQKVAELDAQLSESKGEASRLRGKMEALREANVGMQALRELDRRLRAQERLMADVRFELWPHEFGAQQQAPQHYQQPATTTTTAHPPPTELSFNTSAGVALSGSTQEAATPPLRSYTTTTSSPVTTPRPFLPFGAFNSGASSSDSPSLATPRPAQQATTLSHASPSSLPITTSGPAHQTTPTVLAPCDFASTSVVATAGPSLAVIPATPTAANYPLSPRPLSTIAEADTPVSNLSPNLSISQSQTQNSASTRSRPASRDSSTGSQSQSQSQPQSQRQSIISSTGTFGQGPQTGLGLTMPTTPEVAPAEGSDEAASTGEEESAEAGVEGEDVPLTLDGEPGFDDEAVAPSDATAAAAGTATGEGEESHL